MGIVVAAAGNKHIEKVIGVDVVANPAAACDLKVDLCDGVEIDLPLLIGDGDIDTQLGLPHLLDRHCNFAMRFLRVVENLDAGPAVAIGIACLG